MTAWTRDLDLRSSDVDFLGHVTASAFLSFFDEARAMWLAQTWKTKEPEYVVAVQRIEYLKELRLHDDPVRITVEVAKVGTSSFEVQEVLYVRDEPRARSEATLVAWSRTHRRSRKLTAPEKEALTSQLGG